MREICILKDILKDRIVNQTAYNKNLIDIRNPELRQIYTQMRDDEMRAIVKLQQKIAKYEASPTIISRIFPIKPHY